MDINFPDVIGVDTNSRGVSYLFKFYNDDIIAKVCTVCEEWRFLNQFNKSKKGFAGTHSLCRDCHKVSNANYREEMELRKHTNDVMDSFHYVVERDFITPAQDFPSVYVEGSWTNCSSAEFLGMTDAEFARRMGF